MDVQVNIKINGREINFLVAAAILLLGLKAFFDLLRRHVIRVLWNTLERGWKGGLQSLALIGGTATTTERSSVIVENWPSMKQLFRAAFRKKIRLLDPASFAENASKHVILYGACSHMGQTCARVMLKYGYSLILVDANLQKLQRLKSSLLRQYIDQFQQYESAQEQIDAQNRRIQLLQVDLSVWTDSTSLEKHFRKVINIADDHLQMPIIVNASGFGGYWQVCEDKLYHELQFDQLIYY